MKKIAFFDAKEYDKPSFENCAEKYGFKFKYFETKLSEDTADLARGCDGVCVFVNDDLGAPVIDKLNELNIPVAALRCAGFNNVDLKHAKGRLTVMRVPAYSPYAVAEHAMAMLLTSVQPEPFVRVRFARKNRGRSGHGQNRQSVHRYLQRLRHENSRLR